MKRLADLLPDLLPDESLGVAGAALIGRVSSFADADSVSLVFAADAESLHAALATPAAAILADLRLKPKVPPDTGLARIAWVAHPRYLFSFAAKHLPEPVAGGVLIHPTAVIGQDVQIGDNVSVGPGAVIGDRVWLGDSCEIGPRVTILAGARIGARVVIQAGAVLGSTGFGYAQDPATRRYVLFPQQGRLVIEDDVEIGANTTIDRGALGETRIGAGSKIDNLVHIGHNCIIGRDVIIAAQTGISGSSVIEDGAILGGQVGIGEHARVGPGVILGGGAGVLSGKKMKGPGQVFWGRPARPLKEYLRDLARLRRS